MGDNLWPPVLLTSVPLTPVLIAQIRQRRAAITKPPWKAEHYNQNPPDYDWRVTTGPQDPRYPDHRSNLTGEELSRADAEFIADAPENIDWLVEEVERLRGRLKELEWCSEEGARQYCPVCGYHQLVELRPREIPHSRDCWLGQEFYGGNHGTQG